MTWRRLVTCYCIYSRELCLGRDYLAARRMKSTTILKKRKSKRLWRSFVAVSHTSSKSLWITAERSNSNRSLTTAHVSPSLIRVWLDTSWMVNLWTTPGSKIDSAKIRKLWRTQFSMSSGRSPRRKKKKSWYPVAKHPWTQRNHIWTRARSRTRATAVRWRGRLSATILTFTPPICNRAAQWLPSSSRIGVRLQQLLRTSRSRPSNRWLISAAVNLRSQRSRC